MHQHIRHSLYYRVCSALAATLLLSLAAFSAARAADEAAAPPPVVEGAENIVITGQRPGVLRQLMNDFILEIGDPVASARGYARWRDRLCVGVYNLPDSKVAQYIADKITITALDVGLKTGSPGCEPNLHIVFSPDARALAARMVEESPLVFHPFGKTEYTTQGAMALAEFTSSDAPVRWWQITMVVDEVGNAALQLPGLDMPIVRGVASRLKSPIQDAIWGSLVIVDASKLPSVSWPQLSDYLTMVALVQVDPDARPSGYNSILNLFSAEQPPSGMTEMDLIYLRALYSMNTMMLPNTQRGVFADRMLREMGKP